LAEWTASGHEIPTLRLALPSGHGSDLLFRHLRTQWARIGVPIERGNAADADLWLIDMVAPADTASWYLRQFMCVPGRICDHFADGKLIEAKDAATPEQRIDALRTAASSYNDTTPFIPLFRPIRWSLVAPTLDGFTPNGRAIHPIDLIRFGRARP
jgi:peptide/nickel transport system substrate-binding protein